ncbi:hypothetical protein [Streptosporangium carneum]|uniref:Uncharacterized protein n=1 Tax=Streptosporangium carneum TaxID=47481 RepID=A0A9W6MHE4_9ACTN|nr:hypothetical protein [Streptosporangium carneum]GLK14156.1 hypothetical protein GCM10017600_75680 [Streptosporangium carneum]
MVLAVLLYGTVAGGDDLFPFGPMVQYAFSVPPDGEIRSLHLQSETASGGRTEIPIEPYYVGVRRAELETQLTRYERDPSLLQGLADTYSRLRPQDPRPIRLRLVTRVITLKDRRPVSTRDDERVSWSVR